MNWLNPLIQIEEFADWVFIIDTVLIIIIACPPLYWSNMISEEKKRKVS